MFCSLLREERRERMIGFFVVGVVGFCAETAEVSTALGKEITVIGDDWEQGA